MTYQSKQQLGAGSSKNEPGTAATGRNLSVVNHDASPPDLQSFSDIMEQFLQISGTAFVKILDLSRRSLLVELSAQGAPTEIADIRVAALRLLLDTYAPPSVLVDARYECLCSFGSVERYLRVEPGETRANLLAIAQDWLRPRLKAALASASRGPDEPTLAAEPRTEPEDPPDSCSVAVLPFHKNDGDRLFLVSLLEAKARINPDRAGRTKFRRVSRPNKRRAIDIEAEPERPLDEAAAEQIAHLSPRQRAVLELVAKGRSNKQIAWDLSISRRTVESHRALMMSKLGARTFADLMRLFAAST
jgi:DNA-binding CsgD family transcriptional regulator